MDDKDKILNIDVDPNIKIIDKSNRDNNSLFEISPVTSRDSIEMKLLDERTGFVIGSPEYNAYYFPEKEKPEGRHR